MYSFKNDKFKGARGRSRLLDVSCERCAAHLCYYQKDGPGMLKRMYVDRMVDLQPVDKDLVCPGCARQLGVRMVYAKEQRDAYRLFAGAVAKKTVSADTI